MKKYIISTILLLLGLIYIVSVQSWAGIYLCLFGIYKLPQIQPKIRLKYQFTKLIRSLICEGNKKLIHTTINYVYPFCLVFIFFLLTPFTFAQKVLFYTAKQPTYIYNCDFKAYKKINRFQPIKVIDGHTKGEFFQTDDFNYVKIKDVVPPYELEHLKAKIKAEEDYKKKLAEESKYTPQQIQTAKTLIETLVKENKLIKNLSLKNGLCEVDIDENEWEKFRKYKLLKIIRTMIEQYKEL